MNFGICYNVQKALHQSPAGVDYIKLSGRKIHSFEPELIQQIREAVESGRINTYSGNGLFPADLRLTGPEVNFGAIRDYCDKTFYRLDELGARMLVFGAGKAKHVPEGFPREKAWDQLFELGHIMSAKAKEHGQMIAIEPLSYNEVNIVNTVEDAVCYAKMVNCDNFKVLVDFYHFSNNGEDFASLEKNRDWIVHTHFASAGTRNIPRTEDDWRFFTKCISKLKQIGYTGNMSFEGHSSETDNLNAIFTKMKEIEQSLSQ